MKLEDIDIQMDPLKEIEDRLSISALKEIHSKYCDSIDQILTLLSSPLLFMSLSMMKVKNDHLSIEKSVKLGFLINNLPKDPKDAATSLVNLFKEALEESSKTIFEEAIKESNELCAKNDIIKTCFRNIGLNALINTWTLFESYSKEIWVKCLNNYPHFLNPKIINTKVDNDNGILGKSIPLSMLSKYKYDVSNHLGELLSIKYDFTGVDGIKKAFKDLFYIEGSELDFLLHRDLAQLEITRHILVHNSGIIDNSYLSRTKRNDEKIGDKIEFDVQEINSMINYSISSIKQILLLADSKINSSRK